MTHTRRAFLVQGGVICGVVAACSSPGRPSASGCTQPSLGDDSTHCLVERTQVRVVGGVTLLAGQAVLTNVDDNTAVILARDTRGLHALSAICTHACCILALCGDTRCGALTPTPEACGDTVVVAGNHEGESALCPCHGSTFRLVDGMALTGPATTALPSYAVFIDDQDVLVDTGILVDAATRV
jgi:nitrite reductase/ring-hydroxylating ferredoxin subunit